MNCLICYDDVNERSFKCNNCTNNLCNECVTHYFNDCKQSGIVPCCPHVGEKNKRCLEIAYSNVKYLDENILHLYNDCIYEFLSKNKDLMTEIEHKKLISSAIENLINIKRNFVSEKFPAAVRLTTRIAFSKKIDKVTKENRKKIEVKVRGDGTAKNCPNSFCPRGILLVENNIYTCNRCQDHFCIQCEKKMNSSHVCSQEDIESVNLIKSFIKCPKCKFPVLKSEGCNFITCSNCNTDFSYTTGEETNHGSYNNKISVKEAEKYTLSSSLVNSYNPDFISLIRRIEDLEPKDPSREALKELIDKIAEKITGNTSLYKLKNKLSKEYEKYKLHVNSNNIYYSLLHDIMDKDKKKELVLEDLINVLERIC